MNFGHVQVNVLLTIELQRAKGIAHAANVNLPDVGKCVLADGVVVLFPNWPGTLGDGLEVQLQRLNCANCLMRIVISAGFHFERILKSNWIT